MKKAIKLQVFGRVQGVGFRYFTQQYARKSGLVGFVQNEVDGSVTVVAQGSQEQLDELLAYIRSNPGMVSRVTKINTFNIDLFDADDFKAY